LPCARIDALPRVEHAQRAEQLVSVFVLPTQCLDQGTARSPTGGERREKCLVLLGVVTAADEASEEVDGASHGEHGDLAPGAPSRAEGVEPADDLADDLVLTAELIATPEIAHGGPSSRSRARAIRQTGQLGVPNRGTLAPRRSQ